MGLVMTNAHNSGLLGEPKTMRKSSFAQLIGVSPGRVSQMIADGLPVEPDGRVDVARGKLWVQANVSQTRAAAQSRQSELLPLGAQLDPAAERMRLLREQADSVALKNAALRRELVPAAEVEREWSGILRLIRSGILAAPSRLRQLLPHLTADDVEQIDSELRRVLEEIANAK